MDLNELQSVRSKERQTAELQQLRESFYEEVGDYIDQLERERERAADRTDDPFSDPEVQRLTDDIETAKGTVESLYERRIGKVVKQASLEAAGMGAETEGLTREERDAFESIVATIEANRERVLDGVVAGEPVDLGPEPTPHVDAGGQPEASADAPPGTADPAGTAGDPVAPDPDGSPEPEPEPGPERAPPDSNASAAGADASTAPRSGGETPDVDAADLMGDQPTEQEVPAPPGPDRERGDDPDPSPADPTPSTDGGTGIRASTGTADAGDDAEADSPPVEHTTVHVTADVGEILGIDDRTYELAPADVVRLPAPNAEALIEREAAERL